MTDENEPVQHCTVDEPVNLPTALEAAAIEYLDVDDQRTIVIYQHAILMVIASEGQATAAREFTVELWEEPPDGLPRDPDDLITAFLDELLATTDAVLVEFEGQQDTEDHD
ncbi:hypothetical protein SAMN05192561_12511 [Halopenitus malekzadehii]|uniref:Uncharacterized protein n=1 Tax=Halopenitus malekzadehii TaxID=1267564 RepID=A0A1H6K017_9EURY|nr:hypothetical protein [Halopenitus malekzadehii]SEH66602.1 hypothetical protein SAMN05192561_12511 [Halopenitus malekzadehii]